MARRKEKRRGYARASWPTIEVPWRLHVREPATDAARAMLEEVRQAPDNAHYVIDWLLSGDEAVACAALDRWGRQLLDQYAGGYERTKRARVLVEAMIPLAEVEAKEEGLVWTPRIDRVREMMAPFHELLPELDRRFLEPLTHWIGAQTSTEPLKALWRASGNTVLKSAIARHTHVIDRELVELDLTTPDDAMRWCARRDMPADARQALLERILEGYRTNPSGRMSEGGSWPWTLANAISKLQLSETEVGRVLDVAAATDRTVVGYLLKHAPLTRAQFDRLFEAVAESRYHVEALASHPYLSEEQALQLWNCSRTAKCSTRLLANERLQTSQALRDAMSSHKSMKTQRDLFRSEKDPAKIPERFAAYFRWGKVPAVNELLATPSEMLTHLTPEHLLPLLENDDRRVRLAGIQMVAKLGVSEVPARERGQSR